MPDNTEYIQKFYDVEEIPAPDDLINADPFVDIVSVLGDSELKRGTLLMMNDGGVYIPATLTGINDGRACVILAETLTLEEGQTTPAAAYVMGVFNAARVILPWETEDDDHGEQIESIRAKLRAQTIILR